MKMSRNMKIWIEERMQEEKKIPLPILSFPAIQLMGINVNELIHSSELQAEGMTRIVEKVNMPAAVSLMDLSVEAEAFGAEVKYFDYEVPAVVGKLVYDTKEAENLRIPAVGSGRTGINLKTMKLALKSISDRPVFAGTIGPFSMAGRLMGVSDAVVCVRRNPEMVKILLEKTTEFLVQYIKAFKETGANGVIMAEPLAGLLSPKMAAEFSNPYVKKIIKKVQDENFAVIYHNCGGSVAHMIDSLVELKAMGYHFGNAIEMSQVVSNVPKECLVMGNLDPAGALRNGTTDEVYNQTIKLLEENTMYANYLLSTGCDVPPTASWKNIETFFKAAKDFYTR